MILILKALGEVLKVINAKFEEMEMDKRVLEWEVKRLRDELSKTVDI